MKLFDFFKNKKTEKTEIKTVIPRHDYSFSNSNNSKTLEVVRDVEVAQCLMRVKDQVLSVGYTIEVDNKNITAKHDYIADLVKNYIDDIICLCVQAWVYGNKVYEINYKADVNNFLIPVELRQISNGIVRINQKTNELIYLNQVLPPYVYKMIVSKDLEGNKEGDGLINIINTMICNKINANDYYLQVLKSFSAPDKVIFANVTEDDKESTLKTLEKSEPLAFILNHGDDYKSITHNINHAAFLELKQSINQDIQKLILGQTLTSSINGGGSYAAASVHKQVSDEKIQAFCNFAQFYINDFIKTFLAVNKLEVNALFSFKRIVNIQKDRADRDKVLFDLGARFTQQYLLKNYDFEQNDVYIIDASNSAKLSTQLADVALKKTKKIDAQEKIDELANNLNDESSDKFLQDLKNEIKKSNDLQDFTKRLKILVENQANDYKHMQDSLKAAEIYGFCDAQDGLLK